MLIGVLLRSVLVVLGGMQRMAVGYFGVMSGLLVIARLGVLGSFAMVLGRMLMMVRGELVMFVNVMVIHRRFPVVMARYGFEHRHGR
ncbi:MAG: hypothetical protein WB772_01205 [Xanthobacteraceae bacterium]